MGYWNGWANYAEWAEFSGKRIVCSNCGNVINPKSPRQKTCARDDSSECDDDVYYQKLWDKGKHPLQLNGFVKLFENAE